MKTRLNRFYLLLLLPLLAFSGLRAQDKMTLPEGVKQLSSVEGITEYRLDNGLQVLLFPDPSKPTVTVNVTYHVGSRHEGYGETGMAHLLEHLVFKGTPDHPNIPQELTEHGARPNGSTWYDRTNYFETFAASEKNLDWALDLEADRMVNSFIAKKDLDSEMTVVRNEFESGENSPTSVLMERVLSTMFLWHNYGKSTIGSRADLENVPIGRLQDFYRKYYQPDNATLIVAGAVEPESTLKLINEKFGKIPAPERKLYETYTRDPIQDGERFAELRRTGDVQLVQAAYHIPPGSHVDYVPTEVLVEVLTSEPGGRIYKSVVETGLGSSQWGWAAELAEPGFALFNVDVLKDDDASLAEAALLAAIDSVKLNPPTEEEVKRAKDRLLKNFNLNLRQSDRFGLAMSEYIAQGDWRLAFIYRDRLEAVTPEQVLDVANKYFKQQNRTIGRFIPTAEPDRSEIPNKVDVAALVEGYEGRAAVAEGEAFDPTYDNIDARAQRGKMAGNIKYSFVPKETRGDAVVALLSFDWGDLASLRGRKEAGDMAGSMLMMGSKKYTRQQIQDKLDELKARVFLGGGPDGSYAYIETEREQLPAVIDLVGEIMRNPTFPAEELETMRKEQIARIEESRSEPRDIAFTELSRKLNPLPKDHPDYETTFDEQLERTKAVKLEEIKKFYADFYGASNLSVGISGDFDPAVTKEAIERNFGDWKSPAKYQRIENKHIAVKGEDVKFETPDKANAMFLAAQTFPMNKDDADYPAMMLGNYMLGGGFLNSRLATRIRQQDGLSYGVGSSFSAQDEDANATFRAYAIYAPENREALEKAFREEIERVRKEGFTAEELAAARDGFIQSMQVSRAQDNRLAGTLQNQAYLGRTFAWDKKMEEKIMALSVADINAAMKKNLDLSKMIFIKAGDFAKSEKDVKP